MIYSDLSSRWRVKAIPRLKTYRLIRDPKEIERITGKPTKGKYVRIKQPNGRVVKEKRIQPLCGKCKSERCIVQTIDQGAGDHSKQAAKYGEEYNKREVLTGHWCRRCKLFFYDSTGNAHSSK